MFLLRIHSAIILFLDLDAANLTGLCQICPKGSRGETTSAQSKAPAANASPAPDAKEAAKSVNTNRRRLVWACIWGYLGVNFLMFLRFFFPRALYEPNTVFDIGFPADFALGIDQRFLMTNRVWVVREPDRLFVIFARCTHLGCTPEWKPAENKFKCPCHGSGYDSEGVNFEGPAPRPMDRALCAVGPDGENHGGYEPLVRRRSARGREPLQRSGSVFERVGVRRFGSRKLRRRDVNSRGQTDARREWQRQREDRRPG